MIIVLSEFSDNSTYELESLPCDSLDQAELALARLVKEFPNVTHSIAVILKTVENK